MGKRQLGELQPSELVVAIMISDLGSVPMQDVDIPLLSGIVPVVTLIVAEVIMSYLSLKFKSVRKFITGKPNIVIYNGEILEDELEKLRFNLNDLISELRFNGQNDISNVNIAVVETSGKLSVITKSSNGQLSGLPCMVISDGSFNKEELIRSGHSEVYIKNELQKRGIEKVKQVLIAMIDENNVMYVQEKKRR